MHYLPPDDGQRRTAFRPGGLRPEWRLLIAAGFILGLSLLPNDVTARVGAVPGGVLLAAGTAAVVMVSLWIRISWRDLGRRWRFLLPCAGLFALSLPLNHGSPGWWMFAGVVTKSLLAFTALWLVVQATSLDELLRGLRRLGVPIVLLATVAMMNRYSDLFREEYTRVRRAQAARSFGTSRWQRIRLAAAALGRVVERGYQRGERVHAAMLARGYDGTMP